MDSRCCYISPLLFPSVGRRVRPHPPTTWQLMKKKAVGTGFHSNGGRMLFSSDEMMNVLHRIDVVACIPNRERTGAASCDATCGLSHIRILGGKEKEARPTTTTGGIGCRSLMHVMKKRRPVFFLAREKRNRVEQEEDVVFSASSSVLTTVNNQQRNR